MTHDLVVVGAGSAGLAAATFAARMGAKVALIEADRVGGDCTWTGCVPSKALIHAAAVVHRARTSGFLPSTGPVDFDAVRRHVVAARASVFDDESPERLRARGIELVAGRARFVDGRSVEVNGARIGFRHAVICTGASPVAAPIPGLEGVDHLTHETIFDLDRLPASLLVVGGGPVGSELAQAYRRLGSDVTLVEATSRLVPVADPEAASMLARSFGQEGVEVVLNAAISRVERDSGGGVVAWVEDRVIRADRLLMATGRRPRVDGLGLEGIGVAAGPGGIETDHRLRTSAPHIYAAGDVTGGPQFTHYAVWQGFAGARNALFPGSARGVRGGVPWAVFTDPEIAQVGLAEAEARGRAINVRRLPMARVDRTQTDADAEGFIKLITTGRRERILGATIVGAGAADVANQLAAPIETGMRMSDLATVLHIYPTRGYAVAQLTSEASLQAARKSLPVRLLRPRP